MAVPTQGELHRVLLEITDKSTSELTHSKFRDAVVSRMVLTEDDLQERTSTQASRLMTNIGFALSKLARAGLLDRPQKGSFVISKAGKEFLRTHSGRIGFGKLNALIEQKKAGKGQVLAITPDDTDPEEDPEEKVREGYEAIRQNLIRDLLNRLLEISPDGFERLVLSLLEKLGYGVGKVVGKSGDGGIDVEINQDALGLEKVYVQAKRWQQAVGAPQIREFAGSLSAQGAVRGVFVTTSRFTPKALEEAKAISQGHQTVLLMEGQQLASLMLDRDVGVVTYETYTIKKLDENYFAEI